MLLDFFNRLRKSDIPVTIGEYLTMLEGMADHVAGFSVDEFYYYARLSLIKDERFYDRFDTVFSDYMAGAETLFDALSADIPDEWLRANSPKDLTEEERQRIEAMGGWDKLMETLKKRLEEQEKRHQGGSKWIGTGGTSPFGAYGYNPEGVRIGQSEGRQGRAVKVWDRREYKNFDDTREMNTRSIKLAMRKLRRFAGGSMDYHVTACEELFSAAKSEFKRLEYFYFHNFIYEKVWKNNLRRHTETWSTAELIRSYSGDYRVFFVGDAAMSPYEIASPGGSVEHWNEEAGALWMQRMVQHFPRLVWLNPESRDYWDRTPSNRLTRQLIGERMFPLSVSGLEEAINCLKRPAPPPISTP